MFWRIAQDIMEHPVRPAVEIIILGIAIYYAFVFIRGSRGAPVVYGFLALMVVMTILTSVLNLEVLSWLLRTFVAFSALAVLVIFQPELRRILAELGTQSFFNTSHEQ